ncbi:hypothetical protein RYH80_03175 [Halobaculum sp. MBLA0147]|uniref:hypothetical protein n=1 Tax=Halobaculum sp. MBLA0147 TaxID=3079934 RepID=UPI0035236386
MDRSTLLGAALTAVGLVGYAVGVAVAYPGRAFSVTAVTVGLALLVVDPFPSGGETA